MKPFMDEDFLLGGETARRLYHEHAERMPIIDYHCHINPQEIAENRRFETITQAWLGGDHYKWRLMRANGVDEALITGDRPDREKFQAFAETIPRAIGNPVYHWVHLELKRYFDCDTPLNGKTAAAIWEACNTRLRDDDLQVRGIIARSRVTHIATTDDPADSLEWHRKLRDDASFSTVVVPAWRPDKALNIEKDDFPAYLDTLGRAAGVTLRTWRDLPEALGKRLDFFASMGCRASDHGLNACVFAPATDAELEAIFAKRMDGAVLSPHEIDQHKTALLLFLAGEYARRGWVMELHYGTLRNANSAAFARLGPDTGYDCIRSADGADGLAPFLDALAGRGQLPKTLVFSLNPNDTAVINSVAGCFQRAGVAGGVQQGSAWWFNDSKTGMIDQLTGFANLTLLANFIGMLTDSRSFLSYARHEYFRRILCDLIGKWVDEGEYPADTDALGTMVEDIAYRNAVRFFGF